MNTFRSFSRLVRVMADQSCEKVFVLSDYVNKQHGEFLGKKDIPEFIEETLCSVSGVYSIVIIRIHLTNIISSPDILLTRNRKGDRTELVTVELPESYDDESIRSHTYKILGRKVFGNVAKEVLWREEI